MGLLVVHPSIQVEVHNGVHIRARIGSRGPNERYRILMKRRDAKQRERGGMGFLIRTARVRVPLRPPTPWKQKLAGVFLTSKSP